MSPLRACGLLLALFSAGCTNVAIGDLQRGGGANDGSLGVDAPASDAASPGPDVPTNPDVLSALDAGTPLPDVLTPPSDVVVSTPDVVVSTPDVVVSTPDVVVPTPDVVMPRPDVITPVDRPTVCEACTPFAPVDFCRGTGMGACLSYAGCADGCAVCAAPAMGGDTCANAPVISTRDRSRAVFTTCGASDNLNAGCGRTGPDIAVTLRIARTGRATARVTVPEGVGVVFGYDRFGGACRTDSSARACNNATPQRTQGFDETLTQGDWTLYIVTTVPSTVVIETDLP
ncbi:MAG: hypothetical protein U0325_07815 [Polyangiales bacterium]